MKTPAELLALARLIKETPGEDRSPAEDVSIPSAAWDAAQILAEAVLTGEPQRSMTAEELRAQGLERVPVRTA